ARERADCVGVQLDRGAARRHRGPARCAHPIPEGNDRRQLSRAQRRDAHERRPGQGTQDHRSENPRHHLQRLQGAIAGQHRNLPAGRREHPGAVPRRQPEGGGLRGCKPARGAGERGLFHGHAAEVPALAADLPMNAGTRAVIALLFAARALAQTVEESYRSKSITMLVGGGAGGGYDPYARVFARHLSRHIPGNPNIIAKNMPAAAGLAAASTLYSAADKDGATIAAFTNGAAMDPLFGNASARYDAQKFGWLGSIGKLQNVCATWHRSEIKTIAAARAREVIVAAAGATSNTAIVPKTLNALVGTKFKVIAGYDTGAGLTLAVERGEAEGICGLSWSTIKASRPHWIS